VRIEVMNESKKRQVPWESSSLTGDFYFIKKAYPSSDKISTQPALAPLKTKEKRIQRKKIRVKVKQGYWKKTILGEKYIPPVYEERWIEIEE
jgi:hypothetical protein